MRVRWKDAVRQAVVRVCAAKKSMLFTRSDLLLQLPEMKRVTMSRGATPDMTMERELEELRDLGEVDFLDYRGSYSIRGGRLRLLYDRAAEGRPE